MTRKEHLEFCKVCLNRKFSPLEGIICKLTDRIANFKSACPNFSEDRAALEHHKIFEESQQKSVSEDATFGLDKLGIRNGFLAGSILLSLGLGWLVWGLSIDRLFYYPFILILFGGIALLIAVINRIKNQKIKRLAQEKLTQEVID